ncbi:MAG: FG-GAP repeat domain-containing protein [Planctomycetota bacterium]
MSAKTLSFVPAALVGLLGTVPAAAQTTPPPIPIALRARFGFLGPEIVKIGHGIGGLLVADVDGDGRCEVFVNDSRRARLLTLRWDGAALQSEAISTDGQIASYALADVDGRDGPELLLADNRGRLHVRALDGSARRGAAPIELGLGGRGTYLLVGDLDGDGADDVVAMSRSGLRRVTELGGAVRMSPIEAVEDNAYGLKLADVDGDGALDLWLIAPGANMNLRLRRGAGDGTFGPWLVCNLQELRYAFPARSAGGEPALAVIDGPQRRVATYRFARDGGDAALEWWAFGEPSAVKQLPFALADVDNDGDEDLVVAQPEKARLLLLLWQDGGFVARIVPTLAGVSSVAAGDVDGDGAVDLVVASAEEEALAWKSGALPLDAFPERLPTRDKPVTAAVDPRGGALVLARGDRRKAHLSRTTPGGEPVQLAEIDRLGADPLRMVVADIGPTAGPEAAFIVPGDGLRIVPLGGDAGAAAAAAEAGSGDAAGFARKVDDGALALTVHDDAPALMVARDRFVRVFRSDAAGGIQVLTQDNGPEGADETSLATRLADGTRLYLDKKGNKLLQVRSDGSVTSVDVPSFDFTHMLPHGDAALLLSTRGVLRVPLGSGPSLTRVAVHEPPTERTSYWHGVAGDFDHDGVCDLALMDGNLPGVQILAGGADGLRRALAMPVFEVPPSDEPNNEPRDIVCGDIDGDGRDDLVLVAHDRVLVYLQEK